MLPPRFASLAIVVCLVIAGLDIITGLEHWPFGSYPMYSMLYSDRFSRPALYGVTDRGEILLRDDKDFSPFDQARLIASLDRLQNSAGGIQKLDQALRDLLRLYNRRNAPLRSLRLYTVRWVLLPGSQGSESPQERILIAQASGGDAN